MTLFLRLAVLLLLAGSPTGLIAGDSNFPWPSITRTQKPWTYWWWMGSAVDTNNIARQLAQFHDAGLGGVHIIPIYGSKGWESNYILYLSPRWMDMLSFTIGEANRLDMGVDMTTGTGWCFGGPHVTDEEANASPVVRQFEVAAEGSFYEKFNAGAIQALMAFDASGQKIDLLPKLAADGAVHWTAEGGPWRVYAISQKPSGQRVKRAAPGGEGWMLNPFYPPAMTNYLRWFDEAFTHYTGPRPRSQYMDSYEYRSSWAPDLFTQFERRRGYRLQDELPALFGKGEDDHTARVKCDFRETLSDVMVEQTIPAWVQWAHDNGFLTRYQAHGSPGNLLDLYGDADIPETEMFHLDRSKLISKFASSAAHVEGHPLTSSETGTWLKEHFTETLADMKFLQDDMFLSGINHIFYHGACYSPEEAGWPGWHFYASFEMNPRNSIWRDVQPLNAYAARCQSILQSGHADNDVLLYWPIHDFWSQPGGLVEQMTVSARHWFEDQPIGQTAKALWEHGYQFDYISDRGLASARAADGGITVPGGSYRAIVVPICEHIPLQTFSNLVALAGSGAVVIFDQKLPSDVPGLYDLERRREELKALLANAARILQVGDVDSELRAAQVRRESLFDHAGLMCTRRADDEGHNYFIANRGEQPFDGWLELATPAKNVMILDPMTGSTGLAATRQTRSGHVNVELQLAAGQSILLRAFAKETQGPAWTYWKDAGTAVPLTGTWQVKFLEGGPELPASYTTDHLASWTTAADTNSQRFAGAARYTLKFDAPADGGENGHWKLDLGQVCQSARVRLNGHDYGTLLTPPFQTMVSGLKRSGNILEVEVANVSANRIRDLDRRGVKWKNYHDINFVNVDYHPFDASNWPITDSGLLGPVTLTPVAPQRKTHSITETGAVGDGKTLDTRAIQEAIDRCSADGGGIVLVPPGVFVTGSIFLKQGVSLEVEDGGALQGSQDTNDYPWIKTRIAGLEMKWPAALVNAQSVSNFSITGKGVIDGEGLPWWRMYWAARAEEPDGVDPHFKVGRPRLIHIMGATNATVAGLTLKNSAFWTLQLTYCDGVLASNITVRNPHTPVRAASSDGIDIDSSCNVIVDGCDVVCDDDGICLKSGRDADGLRINRPTENVIIRNCHVGHAAAMVAFGSETSGGIRHVRISHCRADDNCGCLVRLKSRMGRGGIVEDVTYENIEADHVRTVFDCNMDAHGTTWLPEEFRAMPPPELGTPVFRDITVRSLTARHVMSAGSIAGLPKIPIQNMTLENVSIEADEGFVIRHAPGLHFMDVTLNGKLLEDHSAN
ncbi:MAG TPA: glycosyl hydrolase [Verrucomicrobiae bacterium]|jgi:polygalacturonase|nr:glycosyl hydrolase [Verrucomicrobiae bacterium]